MHLLSDKSLLIAAIFTKNEERNISECMDSLDGIEDIIIVDSSSEDKTRIIAESNGASVLEFNWNGEYPRKKQWTLNQLNHAAWILMMDADLRATPSLIQELQQLILCEDASAISIPIEYWFRGKKLKFGFKVRYLGALRTKETLFPDVELPGEGYGDIEFHYQPKVNGRILKAKNAMIHNDNDPISSWVERHNKYAVYQAKINQRVQLKKMIDSNKTSQGRLFSKIPFKSLAFFLYSYLIRAGFLDGTRGFQYNYLLAHHYYLQKIYEKDFI